MSEKVKKGRLKAAAVAALVLALMLIALAVCETIVHLRAGKLDYMNAGKRWSGDGTRYAVINAYAEASDGVSEDQVYEWEHSMDTALTEAAVFANDGARAWTWTASFETNLTLTGAKGSTSALVTVCAGDFFTFHSLDFICGSGFSTDGLNPMGVVLDNETAWKIFGAENIVGMTFTVDDNEYIVTGVCKPESKRGVYGHTYGTTPRMYMSYAGYAKLGEGTFTTYECALPNPVKSFAKNIFDNVVRLNENRSDIIEITDRFSLKSRFDNMKSLGYSWIRENRIGYPYWENEARVYDYRYAVLMIWEIVFASVGGAALLTAIVLIVTSGYSPIATAKNVFRKAASNSKKRKTERGNR